MSARASSPASSRTAVASGWPAKASSVTAGSSSGSSSRRRSGSETAASTIDRLLEGLDADAAVRVEESLALGAQVAVAFHRAFDGIDDAVLVEAGTGDLAEAGVFRARAAEQELVVLGP